MLLSDIISLLKPSSDRIGVHECLLVQKIGSQPFREILIYIIILKLLIKVWSKQKLNWLNMFTRLMHSRSFRTGLCFEQFSFPNFKFILKTICNFLRFSLNGIFKIKRHTNYTCIRKWLLNKIHKSSKYSKNHWLFRFKE